MLTVITAIEAVCAGQDAHLAKIPESSVNPKDLNWRSIPALGPTLIEHGQLFVLHATHLPDLTVIPVTFLSDISDGPGLRCGVYFLTQGGLESFVRVVGDDLYPWRCAGPQAVGMMTDQSSRPRLIFMFFAYNGPSNQENPTPFILSWSEGKKIYELDKVQTQWIFDQSGPSSTVAQVRRLLAHYPHTSKELTGKPIQ